MIASNGLRMTEENKKQKKKLSGEIKMIVLISYLVKHSLFHIVVAYFYIHACCVDL